MAALESEDSIDEKQRLQRSSIFANQKHADDSDSDDGSNKSLSPVQYVSTNVAMLGASENMRRASMRRLCIEDDDRSDAKEGEDDLGKLVGRSRHDSHHVGSQKKDKLESSVHGLGDYFEEDGNVISGVSDRIREFALWYFSTKWVQKSEVVIICLSCLCYVIETYQSGDLTLGWAILELVFSIIFFVDFCCTLVLADSPFNYILSGRGMIDIVSIIPGLLVLAMPFFYDLLFLRFLRLIKAFRVLRFHRMWLFNAQSPVAVQAGLLGLKLFGLVFITTALIFATQELGEVFDTEPFSNPIDHWHDSLYYTVVTLSTVGYGDISPATAGSRMFILCVITFSFLYVPYEVGQLLDALASRPKNKEAYKYVGSKLHVIIAKSGDDGFSAKGLSRLLSEVLYERKGTPSDLMIVVMANVEPSEEINELLKQPIYKLRVSYFRGSPGEAEDLADVRAEYADCIFLFPSSRCLGTPGLPTLCAIGLQRFLDRTPKSRELYEAVEDMSQGVPGKAVVVVPELANKVLLKDEGIDTVICMEEFKLAVLAFSSLYPSFMPFVVNTIRSVSSSERASMRRKYPGKWSSDYLDGTTYSIRAVTINLPTLPPSGTSARHGVEYSYLASALYEFSTGRVVLLGALAGNNAAAGLDGHSACSFRRKASLQGLYPYLASKEKIMAQGISVCGYGLVFGPGDQVIYVMSSSQKTAMQAVKLVEDAIQAAVKDGRDLKRGAVEPIMSPVSLSSSPLLQGVGLPLSTSHEEPEELPSVPGASLSKISSSMDLLLEKESERQRKEAMAEVLNAERILQNTARDHPDSSNLPELVDKVEVAHASLGNALRTLSSDMPRGLTGHIIVIGMHQKLEKLLIPLHRLNPQVAVVIVTRQRATCCELLGRLELLKIVEPSLRSLKLYHVFGEPHDVSTLILAGARDASAVVLLSSDRYGYTDEETLIINFALEHAVAGTNVRIVAELHEDRSLYYMNQGASLEAEAVLSTGLPSFGQYNAVLTSNRGFTASERPKANIQPYDDVAPVRSVSDPTNEARSPLSTGVGVGAAVKRSQTSGGASNGRRRVSSIRGAAPSSAVRAALVGGDVYNWPLYAAGNVWTNSVVDIMAVCCYFNSTQLAFFESLLHTAGAPAPAAGNTEAAEASQTPGCSAGDYKEIHITSSRFRGKTYGNVVMYLMSLKCQALGLYRPAGHKGSTLPWSVTNPKFDEPVVTGPRGQCDIVFALMSTQSTVGDTI
ncbi:unnamed protein product [Chrysoparadoxa australica]